MWHIDPLLWRHVFTMGVYAVKISYTFRRFYDSDFAQKNENGILALLWYVLLHMAMQVGSFYFFFFFATWLTEILETKIFTKGTCSFQCPYLKNTMYIFVFRQVLWLYYDYPIYHSLLRSHLLLISSLWFRFIQNSPTDEQLYHMAMICLFVTWLTFFFI